MLAIAILAAASAWLVTRKAPRHRPLAWALTACAGLDAVRLCPLSWRTNVALLYLQPWISALAYGTALGASTSPVNVLLVPMTGVLILGVTIGNQPWETHTMALPGLYGFVCCYGIAASIVRGRGWTISQRVALILIAGDALAVASLCAREWISNQAGVVLVAVAVYQVTWWWMWRRCESM